MIKLRRAQIGKYSGLDAIDVTVKSAAPCFKPLAPTWEMVRAVKRDEMSEEEYTGIYLAKIHRLNRGYLRSLHPDHARLVQRFAELETLTFLCYCPDGAFCHTHLLIGYLVEQFPEIYERGDPVEVVGSIRGQIELFRPQ